MTGFYELYFDTNVNCMSKTTWFNMDLWFKIVENYKTVAWDQNTNKDSKN
jgi:hypothetical protein